MSTDEYTQHPYLADPARPRIIAHRGFVSTELAAVGIVENTRAAFTAALAAGAECLETDCHLTRDGVVVLAHDADLSRVANDPREIAQVDCAELDEVFAVRGGLLTLEQALAEYPQAHWNIDVKSRAAAAPLGRIVAQHGARVLVTSFSDAYRRAALAAAARERHAILPATSPGKRTLIRVLLAVASGSTRLVERAFAFGRTSVRRSRRTADPGASRPVPSAHSPPRRRSPRPRGRSARVDGQ